MHERPAVPKLSRLYRELDPTWSSLLVGVPMQYYVPTETVVYKPGFFVPQVARAYSTHWFVDQVDPDRDPIFGPSGLELLTYEELRNKPRKRGFHGTADFPRVWMCEVWTDTGLDGHTDWHLIGWRFVQQPELGDDPDELPEPMRFRYDDSSAA